ncbi:MULTISPECIES: fumarylacetoacetate hydrolase family protein [unclassified Pseudomonas]|uniref:fumarylacetoacetate hydrolase family protein n=1 Tax=unclassified Pseudomonas TaxID=196821 RepID=UPI001C47BDF9|nr:MULTISPECIES: fumarylacetoacetate hydrolase family protein [unclassified Pseudomonas]
MHICRFNHDRLGLVEGARVFDITPALESLATPTWPYSPGDPLIARLDELRAAAAELRACAPSYSLDEVSLHSLITAPSKIMAAPANYRLHVEQDVQDPNLHHGFHNVQLNGLDKPVEKLGLFLKANSSLVGPADGIPLCWRDRRNDHEVELAVVIGRAGKNIPAAEAFEYIAGYTIGLDMSVRGTEDRSFRKSADGYTVIGPWLTTADEVADPEHLDIWLEVNGECRQHSSTAALTVGIAR